MLPRPLAAIGNYEGLTNVTTVIFILLLIHSQDISVRQPYHRIPKRIIDTLNLKYPGWRLADNLGLLQLPEVKHHHSDTTASFPNLVWGDFDNDRKTDYALFLERTLTAGRKEERLIAFVARSSCFEEHTLRTATEPVYIANYIWLAKKGSQSYDFDTDRHFTLQSDGIDLIIIGKASELIQYKNGRFFTITTSD